RYVKHLDLPAPRGLTKTLDGEYFVLSYGRESGTLTFVSPSTLEPVALGRVDRAPVSGSHLFTWDASRRDTASETKTRRAGRRAPGLMDTGPPKGPGATVLVADSRDHPVQRTARGAAESGDADRGPEATDLRGGRRRRRGRRDAIAGDDLGLAGGRVRRRD